MSLPEVLLWRELRKRPNGLKFRRQHPAGQFVLDFVCLSEKVAIEIDGEAHDSGAAAFRDEARDEWMMAENFRTVRIPAREVLTDVEDVVDLILAQCQPLHQPPAGPPPRAGED